jgi:phosphatidylinositol 4-kinase A
MNLNKYFEEKFGGATSEEFARARKNFILSQAGYSVVSYILQTKDRHNGNILIDKDGHLIHIDFGFIFDVSPAGDMRFENADFKMTKEMIQIVGGSKKSESYLLFVQKSI